MTNHHVFTKNNGTQVWLIHDGTWRVSYVLRNGKTHTLSLTHLFREPNFNSMIPASARYRVLREDRVTQGEILRYVVQRNLKMDLNDLVTS